jgi:hypothetical protein
MGIIVKPELVEVNGKKYKVKNGTYYNINTPDKVIDWLETSRERKQRIRIFYGKSGKCWNEEFDTIGYIGRSTGTIKIPLLIKSSRSIGGGAILDDCIVRIDTKGKNGIVTVFFDDTVKFDHFYIKPSDMMPEYHTNVVTGENPENIHARCKTYTQGVHLADFMNGKRWSK